MKIALIGARGRTGKCVLAELRKRGHFVNGLALAVPETKTNGVNWIQGDATNKGDLQKAINGCNAVICVIGHGLKNRSYIQTEMMNNLVKIAKNIRIVSMTGTGVRKQYDKPSLIDFVLNIAVKILDPLRVKDGIQHARVLKQSDCNWTIVRVLKLANGKKVQKSKLSDGGPALTFVNRVTVAKHLSDLAENNQWKHRMPVISSQKTLENYSQKG